MIEQNASANPEAAQVRATDVDHKPGDDSTPRNPDPAAPENRPKTNAEEPFVGKIPVDDKGRPISSAKSWDDMSTDEKLDQLKRRLDASDRLNAARPRGGIYPGL